jgi:hypothetical protein
MGHPIEDPLVDEHVEPVGHDVAGDIKAFLELVETAAARWTPLVT